MIGSSGRSTKRTYPFLSLLIFSNAIATPTKPAAAPTSSSRFTSPFPSFSAFFPSAAVFPCIFPLPLLPSYFLFHVRGESATFPTITISITLLLGILSPFPPFFTPSCCFLSLSEKINRGLLPPTTFFLVSTFYLLLALLANPRSNPFKTFSNYGVTAINVILLVISGYWMAFRIRSQPKEEETLVEDAEKAEPTIPDENGFEPAIFNACMALTSVYLAMLASAWYTGDISIRPEAVKDNTSMFTAWVFTGSVWAGYALFLYVLIIPLVNDSRTYLPVCSHEYEITAAFHFKCPYGVPNFFS